MLRLSLACSLFFAFAQRVTHAMEAHRRRSLFHVSTDKENESTVALDEPEEFSTGAESNFSRRKSTSNASTDDPLCSLHSLNSRPRRRSSIGVSSYKVKEDVMFPVQRKLIA